MKNWIKQLMVKEHRRVNRMPWPQVVVHYWTGDAPRAQKIRDISTTGLFVLTEDRWFPGTLIVVALQSTNAEYDEPVRSITLLARVVRQDANGCGFDFVTPTSALYRQEKWRPDVQTNQRDLNRFIAWVKSNGSDLPMDDE